MTILAGGNVGIGTTSPGSLLTMQGGASTASLLNIASSTGNSVLFIGNNGNVGIGTTSPGSLLTMQGGASTASLLNIASSTGNSVLFIGNNGNVGIGTTSPGSLLTMQGGASTASLLNIASSTGNSVLFIGNNGNVGIGTTTPSSKLQVVGDINLGYGGTTAGHIILQNTANAYTTTLQSSSSQASNLTFTLPPTSGSAGQVLSTDGAGVTSWITASGGLASYNVVSANGLDYRCYQHHLSHFNRFHFPDFYEFIFNQCFRDGVWWNCDNNCPWYERFYFNSYSHHRFHHKLE